VEGPAATPAPSKAQAPDRVGISGSAIVRNSMLSMAANLLPLVVTLVTTPLLLQALGPERFGLLTITTTVLTYLLVVDFGVSRVVVRQAAQFLASGSDSRVVALAERAVVFQGIVGTAIAVGCAAAVPWLVHDVFQVPAGLAAEGRAALWVLLVSIPFNLAAGSLRGVLEARQRFRFVFWVHLPARTISSIATAGLALLGWSIPDLLAVSVAVQAIVFLIFAAAVFHKAKPNDEHIRPTSMLGLIADSSWIGVVIVAGVVLNYLDRALIARLQGLEPLGYYGVSLDIIMRLLIVPTSVIAVVFPASAAMAAAEDQRLGPLTFRSAKYLVYLMTLPLAVLAGLSTDLLGAWMGPRSLMAADALSILAVAALANCLGYVPFWLLQSAGHSRPVALLQLIELPFYLGLAYLLISGWGISGAALAWGLRVVVDAWLLHRLTKKHLGGKLHGGPASGLSAALAIAALVMVAAMAVHLAVDGFAMRVVATLLISAGAVMAARAWSWRPEDSIAVRAMFALRRG
jgi:O-antigen/teichoic acid export membrane protein